MENCNESTLQSLALMKMLHSVVAPLWWAGRIHTGTHCGASRLHSRGRCSGGVQIGQICPPWWWVHTASSQLVGPLGGCGASVHSLPSGKSEPCWWLGHWSLQWLSALSGSLWKGIIQYTIQNPSWLTLLVVTSYNRAMLAPYNWHSGHRYHYYL